MGVRLAGICGARFGPAAESEKRPIYGQKDVHDLSVKGSPGHTMVAAGVHVSQSLAVRHGSKRAATSFYQIMMSYNVSR
jgi:hypothetical protein